MIGGPARPPTSIAFDLDGLAPFWRALLLHACRTFVGSLQCNEVFDRRLCFCPGATTAPSILCGRTGQRPQARALERRYIQINPPRTALWIAFDVDRLAGGLAWQSANLPPPAWSTTTRHNGHGHLVYGLQIPVVENDFGSKSARYLAAIREGIRVRLNADPGFAGLLTKNPVHPDWIVERRLQKLWLLAELAEYVELPKQHRLCLCAAMLDWFAVQRIWRMSSETAASQAAHGSLDKLLKPPIPQGNKPAK